MTDEAQQPDTTAAATPDAAPEAPQQEVVTPTQPGGEVDTLREQLTALQAQNEALEAAKAENMTAAQTLEKERAAWREEVETDRARLRTELRNAALERAGVIGTYHGVVPDVDVRTGEGRKALEKWISDHPEVVRQRETIDRPSGSQALAQKSSKIAEILTGKRKSTLVNAKSLARMFDSN